VLDFLIIALTIFWAVRIICKLRVKKEEPAPAPAAPAPTPEDILLLREIRDALKNK
jgi:large conductance mechanosensitive channel